MLKLAPLIWIILGTTLAGMLVVPVLTVPSLADRSMTMIPAATAAGFLLAIPLALLIARRIYAATAARR
ncbi:hypothetical protein [Microvirga roseola]|uniref:hypothetical protein n=1 Tax=Microvirga roseola TaxID=2883126 RepID=UPI001E3E683E|nr:hypothetical protein [Microvirga roseola]